MKSIVQIELTNHCNRRCVYCGVPTMVRPKGFADFKLIERCVEVLKEIGQTKDFGLHHFGESTMHPKLIEFIKYFNDNGMTPFLNTNGDFLTDELIAKLATVKLNPLQISGHIEYSKRIELWQKCTDAGIPTWYHNDMVGSLDLTNLGGQIDLILKESPVLSYPVLTDPMTQCGFLRKEMGIVLWNGDLTVCCFDYEGHGKFGSIYDPNAAELKPQAFSTCATCPGHPGQP